VSSVDEAFSEIDLASFSQILSERSQDFDEHTLTNPLLHPTMAGLVRRILRRHRAPRRPRPQYPQNPVENLSRLNARTALAVESPLCGNQRLNQRPLLVSEFHPNV
jgi:hypothetical protein